MEQASHDSKHEQSGDHGSRPAGHIEYWSPSSFRFPADGAAFASKLDTDLYALAKAKAVALSLDVSRDGSQFVIFSSDRCPAVAKKLAAPCGDRWTTVSLYTGNRMLDIVVVIITVAAHT